jgi:hypothetical protein
VNTENTPQKPRRGCFFYGCIAGAVCLVAILVAALFGLHQLKKMLNNFTDTQPMALPALQLSKAQIEEVRERARAFDEAVRAGKSAPPLALAGDEILALVVSNPNLQEVSKKLYLTIEGDHVKGQLSIPMADIGLPRFKNRYLNATGAFAVSLRNGVLFVTPQALLVKGKPLPPYYMSIISQQNLAANLNGAPGAAEFISHIQDIQIKNGKLLIVQKKQL